MVRVKRQLLMALLMLLLSGTTATHAQKAPSPSKHYNVPEGGAVTMIVITVGVLGTSIMLWRRRKKRTI